MLQTRFKLSILDKNGHDTSYSIIVSEFSIEQLRQDQNHIHKIEYFLDVALDNLIRITENNKDNT